MSMGRGRHAVVPAWMKQQGLAPTVAPSLPSQDQMPSRHSSPPKSTRPPSPMRGMPDMKTAVRDIERRNPLPPAGGRDMGRYGGGRGRSDSRDRRRYSRSRSGSRRRLSRRSPSYSRSKSRERKKRSSSRGKHRKQTSSSVDRKKKKHKKKHSRSASRTRSPKTDKKEEEPVASAAILCDRLLELRQKPYDERKKNSKVIELYESLFPSDKVSFDCEDEHKGKDYSYSKFKENYFLEDSPDEVELKKRIFMEQNENHSFCINFEVHIVKYKDGKERTPMLMMFEAKKNKLIKAWVWPDDDKVVESSMTEQEVLETLNVKKFIKFARAKGLPDDAKFHYMDCMKIPTIG